MKQILCLSGEPWSSSPGRTQQLISRLREAQILYFAPAQGRLDRAFRQKGKKVRPNVTVYTLPPLLLPQEERYGRLFRMDQGRLGRFVAEKAARHRFSAPLLWTTSPQHVHLLDHLEYGGLVYDCDREWEDLPPAWEGSLAGAADLVFAASPQLRERLSPCSANIALLPNGVNFPMFSRPSGEVPPELQDIRGPVLGWVGTIDAGLDLSPVEHAARARPDWTFVLLGRIREGARLGGLEGLGNVRLLGWRPAVEVPDYVGRFDVCLDLRREDRPYSDRIPRRIYEYLSTGKPIVTCLLPDQVEEFPDVIYGAHSPSEYCRLCQRALEEDPAWVAPRRRDYGAAAAWSSRAREVQRILGAIGLL